MSLDPLFIFAMSEYFFSQKSEAEFPFSVVSLLLWSEIVGDSIFFN